jgi:hypothetical protein
MLLYVKRIRADEDSADHTEKIGGKPWPNADDPGVGMDLCDKATACGYDHATAEIPSGLQCADLLQSAQL